MMHEQRTVSAQAGRSARRGGVEEYGEHEPARASSSDEDEASGRAGGTDGVCALVLESCTHSTKYSYA